MEIREVEHFDEGPLAGHTYIKVQKPSKSKGKKAQIELLVPQDRTLKPRQQLRILPRGAEKIGTAYPELFIRHMLSQGIKPVSFEVETHHGRIPLQRPYTVARFQTSAEEDQSLKEVHDACKRFNYALMFLGRDETKGHTLLHISGGRYGAKARMRLHDLLERLGVKGEFSIVKNKR